MTLTFLTPMLLAGAALIAIPIIIHFIMRRKPKQLIFPAFRFLRQKQRTTVQKLRLRHILLLAMRIMLILLAVFALARPELSGGPDVISPDAAVGVVMVFDTSPSMGYLHNDKSRLDEARELAESFLKTLPNDSKVAIFDTADVQTQIISPPEAINRIRSLQVQPYNRPVTTSLRDVFRFLEQEQYRQRGSETETGSIVNLPLMLCVFSDRTEASWEFDVAHDLTNARAGLETNLGQSLTSVYLDLSLEKPRNLSITGISVRQVQGERVLETPIEKLDFGVARTQPVQIQAHLRVTGLRLSGAKLQLFVKDAPHDSASLQIDVPPGETRLSTVTFAVPVPMGAPVVQGDVRLQINDSLKADDIRHWTLSAPQRTALIVADREADAFYWKTALVAQAGLMSVETKVVTTENFPATISPEVYQIVCLVNVAQPTDEHWKQLSNYVSHGGGLVILPGEDCKPEAYNRELAARVMPGELLRIRDLVERTPFDPERSDHQIVHQFRKWDFPLGSDQIRTWRLWELRLPEDVGRYEVALRYKAEELPAIVERHFSDAPGAGKVLLFTSAMYGTQNDWNNYLQIQGLYLSLVHATTRHIVGNREEKQNYFLREDLRFVLPKVSDLDVYQLSGPDGGRAEIKPNLAELDLTGEGGKLPGNYKLGEPAENKLRPLWARYFSVNLSPLETQLTDPRPVKEQIEELLGEAALRSAEDPDKFVRIARDRLGQAGSVELLPYLMMLALFLLIGEGLLANRFYKQQPEEEGVAASQV